MADISLGVMAPLGGGRAVLAGLGAALGFPPTPLHPLPAPAAEACPFPSPTQRPGRVIKPSQSGRGESGRGASSSLFLVCPPPTPKRGCHSQRFRSGVCSAPSCQGWGKGGWAKPNSVQKCPLSTSRVSRMG